MKDKTLNIMYKEDLMKEWYFNKREYREIERILKFKNKNIRSFVGVKFILPFHIPIRDGGKMLINYKKKDFALIIKQHEVNNILGDLSTKESSP